MKQKFSLSRGFTLVELMIVIAIIGILAAALYPSLAGYFEKSRDTARATGINDYVLALSSYFGDNQSYPGYEKIVANDANSDAAKISLCATELYNEYLSGTYLNAPKNDPKKTQGVDVTDTKNCANTKGGYGYKSLQNNNDSDDYGFAFVMAANMERGAASNLDGGADGANFHAIKALNGDTTTKGVIDSIVKKGEPGHKTLQGKSADHWYYVKYSQ